MIKGQNTLTGYTSSRQLQIYSFCSTTAYALYYDLPSPLICVLRDFSFPGICLQRHPAVGRGVKPSKCIEKMHMLDIRKLLQFLHTESGAAVPPTEVQMKV